MSGREIPPCRWAPQRAAVELLYTAPGWRDKTRAMRTHTALYLAASLALALTACNQGTPANEAKAPASAGAEKKDAPAT